MFLNEGEIEKALAIPDRRTSPPFRLESENQLQPLWNTSGRVLALRLS